MTSGVGLSEMATAPINSAAERGERLLGANVHIPCVRGPVVDPIALAAAGPVEQAQVAMVWLAGGLDFQIAEYDAMYKVLEGLKLDATRMVGMGISPRMTEVRALIIAWSNT